MKYHKVASMFSGIGGIDLAFQQAGYEIVWANEFDHAACETYRHNFDCEKLIECDVKDVNVNSIPSFDILVAGFPCQPFSIGGRQRGFNDKRGNMFFEIARVIDISRPKVVFLENVPNLLEHDNGKTFLVIYNTLASLGYSVRYKVMSATEYANIPQTRSRIFIVAFLDDFECDCFKFPDPVELTITINDIIRKQEKQHNIYYYLEKQKLYNTLNRTIKDTNSIYHIKDRGIIKVKNNMCPTLTANMGTYPDRVPVVKDDFGIRKLTLRECLDFQGFPREFKFPNTITLDDAYKQIGNSVVVSLVREIACKLHTERTNLC